LIVEIVAYDYAFAPLDAADAGDDTGAWVDVLVHAEGREPENSRNGEPGSINPITRSRGQQFTARGCGVRAISRSAKRRGGTARGKIVAQGAPLRGHCRQIPLRRYRPPIQSAPRRPPDSLLRKLWPGFQRKENRRR